MLKVIESVTKILIIDKQKLLYIAHVENEPAVTLSWEHSDYKWVPVDELSQVALRPFFKEAIEYSLLHGHI